MISGRHLTRVGSLGDPCGWPLARSPSPGEGAARAPCGEACDPGSYGLPNFAADCTWRRGTVDRLSNALRRLVGLDSPRITAPLPSPRLCQRSACSVALCPGARSGWRPCTALFSQNSQPALLRFPPLRPPLCARSTNIGSMTTSTQSPSRPSLPASLPRAIRNLNRPRFRLTSRLSALIPAVVLVVLVELMMFCGEEIYFHTSILINIKFKNIIKTNIS